MTVSSESYVLERSERNLGFISLTTLLVSAHYGLGFILGTAEQSILGGASGSLYAVAVGIGMMLLSVLARFYWKQIDPIWTLMGDRYGTFVKIGIGVMSWMSLIGIEAVQIIAATAILVSVGVPAIPTMVSLTALFCLLSLLPVERASRIFRGLLLLNIVVLGAVLWQLHQGGIYATVALDFLPSVRQLELPQTVSVALPTILLVLIDMKCQQFVVRSKSAAIAYRSCMAAGLIFIVLAFLPAAVVMAAQAVGLLDGIDSKAAIPFILGWLGGGVHKPLGILFISVLALPALGLGSNVLRIQTKTSLDVVGIRDTVLNRTMFAGANALLALGIAFKGGEIVGLIVCFYAAYLAAVVVPFTAYLLEQTQRIAFSVISVRISLVLGSTASVLTLLVGLFQPDIVWLSPEVTILSLGAGVGALGLLSTQLVETVVPMVRQRVRE